MTLRSAIENKEFVITCEIGPVKGTNIEEIEESAEVLHGKVTAANITDQQSSAMRLGSLVTSHLVKERGVDPIYQVTCRDRNRIALQSDLLSAAVLGIENVLALTGDLPSLGDHPQAAKVFDLDSVGLLGAIETLNGGHDMAGNDLNGKTNFFPGAVVNPGADTEAALDMQIRKMYKKIRAGAKFIQTQAIYDVELFDKFMKRIGDVGVPILAGVIPLKSVGMARYMNKSVAGVFVPEPLIQKMKNAEDKTAMGIEIAADLIKGLKSLCQGVHIMAIGWEKKVPSIIEAAGLKK